MARTKVQEILSLRKKWLKTSPSHPEWTKRRDAYWSRLAELTTEEIQEMDAEGARQAIRRGS